MMWLAVKTCVEIKLYVNKKVARWILTMLFIIHLKMAFIQVVKTSVASNSPATKISLQWILGRKKHFHTQFLSTEDRERKGSDEQTSCSPLNKIKGQKRFHEHMSILDTVHEQNAVLMTYSKSYDWDITISKI